MSFEYLSVDTQATVLLCERLDRKAADNGPQPLGPKAYARLAGWLRARNRQPGDLLQPDAEHVLAELDATLKLDPARLQRLLQRGAALAILADRWLQQGLWVLGQTDAEYPARYRERLGGAAPPLLFGVGERSLLQGGGLAIVGSRDAGESDLLFAHLAARQCVHDGLQVISGGARGVDLEAMRTALDEDGLCVGILPSQLAESSRKREFKPHLREGRLVLVSPLAPEAGWGAGLAMARNKLIYGLADWALVAATGLEAGGTWTGAMENLQYGWTPLFVRADEDAPEGNRRLLALGADAITDVSLQYPGGLRDWLKHTTTEPAQLEAEVVAATQEEAAEPVDLFAVVWPTLELLLATPQPRDELLASLTNIQRGQLDAWLKYAVSAGLLKKVRRKGRVCYVVSSSTDEDRSDSDTQLSLPV